AIPRNKFFLGGPPRRRSVGCRSAGLGSEKHFLKERNYAKAQQNRSPNPPQCQSDVEHGSARDRGGEQDVTGVVQPSEQNARRNHAFRAGTINEGARSGGATRPLYESDRSVCRASGIRQYGGRRLLSGRRKNC